MVNYNNCENKKTSTRGRGYKKGRARRGTYDPLAGVVGETGVVVAAAGLDPSASVWLGKVPISHELYLQASVSVKTGGRDEERKMHV